MAIEYLINVDAYENAVRVEDLQRWNTSLRPNSNTAIKTKILCLCRRRASMKGIETLLGSLFEEGISTIFVLRQETKRSSYNL